jgi:hypothetical protein
MGSYEVAENFLKGMCSGLSANGLGRFILKRNGLIGSPGIRDGMPMLLDQAHARFG